MGRHIPVAFADRVQGPWRIHPRMRALGIGSLMPVAIDQLFATPK